VTVGDVAVGAEAARLPVEGPRRFGSRRVLAMVAAAGIVAVGWWITQPAAVQPAGNLTEVPVRPGGTTVFGSVATVQRPITVVSVAPRLEAGAATAEVLACRQARPRTRIGVVGPDEIREHCVRTAPAAGARISPEGGWYLIAAVTKESVEDVRINGFDITYRDGIRRGAQTSGEHLVLRGPAGD
jgi:hypothetical protein